MYLENSSEFIFFVRSWWSRTLIEFLIRKKSRTGKSIFLEPCADRGCFGLSFEIWPQKSSRIGSCWNFFGGDQSTASARQGGEQDLLAAILCVTKVHANFALIAFTFGDGALELAVRMRIQIVRDSRKILAKISGNLIRKGLQK